MVFFKIIKNNAYFKRFQTKLRRRREGKTDYYARKRLIVQDKDKYNTPKYRFVARVTNQKIICQVVYATILGDRVLCQANSNELKRYGLTAGLTNYASCYATGLLCARRLLKSIGLDKTYEGKAAYGEDYSAADDKKERRPFKAVLDIGITRTTTGNRVFGCMKGAVDGGIFIPHSTRRFPGFQKLEESEKYDAKVHRDRIFGVHVDKYMDVLRKESQEEYQRRFSLWDACLKKNGVKKVEDIYKKIHTEIRKNPDQVKAQAKQNPNRKHVSFRTKRLNNKERRERAKTKYDMAVELYNQ